MLYINTDKKITEFIAKRISHAELRIRYVYPSSNCLKTQSISVMANIINKKAQRVRNSVWESIRSVNSAVMDSGSKICAFVIIMSTTFSALPGNAAAKINRIIIACGSLWGFLVNRSSTLLMIVDIVASFKLMVDKIISDNTEKRNGDRHMRALIVNKSQMYHLVETYSPFPLPSLGDTEFARDGWGWAYRLSYPGSEGNVKAYLEQGSGPPVLRIRCRKRGYDETICMEYGILELYGMVEENRVPESGTKSEAGT